MAELDKIPQKQSVEIETVKLDEQTLKELVDINNDITTLVNRFGEIYLRKKEIHSELESLDSLLVTFEDEFKAKNAQMREMADSLDEKYPQNRINIQDGTVTYQPGAPTRKQIQQQQQQQSAQRGSSVSNDMKVVKG